MNTVIVKAIMTCSVCPSQWDAWDSEGNYWYLHYRWGKGTAEIQPSSDMKTWSLKEPEAEFYEGDKLDGFIDLDEFCKLAGFGLEIPSG